MLKKTFAVLVLLFVCLTVSFAQNTEQKNDTHWEYLEVSSINYYGDANGNSITSRNYIYLNSNLFFKDKASLDWIGEAGWELVGGVVSREQTIGALYFKRVYNKDRTDKEIEKIKEREKNKPATVQRQSDSNLVDLDTGEAEQKLAAYNRMEEEKLRNALEQVKDVPLKIISVQSKSPVIGYTTLAAEIVIDATQVLLKDSNKYRSSEVDNYFKEVTKKIDDNTPLTNIRYKNDSAKAISMGRNPQKIGEIYNNNSGITLKISVVVNYKGQQNIVAQQYIENIEFSKSSEQTSGKGEN